MKERKNEILDNGKLKYKAEYLNGEWNGIGIEFSSLNFNLIYKGNFSKGKWHRKCIGFNFCKTPITLFSCEKFIDVKSFNDIGLSAIDKYCNGCDE